MRSHPTAMVTDVLKWDWGLLRTVCIKNVKFIIKIRTGYQCVGYFHCSLNLNWGAQNLWMGCMRPAVWTSPNSQWTLKN